MFIAHQIQISSYTAVAPLIKYSWGTIGQLEEVPLSAIRIHKSYCYFKHRTRARQLFKWLDSLHGK